MVRDKLEDSIDRPGASLIIRIRRSASFCWVRRRSTGRPRYILPAPRLQRLV